LGGEGSLLNPTWGGKRGFLSSKRRKRKKRKSKGTWLHFVTGRGGIPYLAWREKFEREKKKGGGQHQIREDHLIRSEREGKTARISRNGKGGKKKTSVCQEGEKRGGKTGWGKGGGPFPAIFCGKVALYLLFSGGRAGKSCGGRRRGKRREKEMGRKTAHTKTQKRKNVLQFSPSGKKKKGKRNSRKKEKKKRGKKRKVETEKPTTGQKKSENQPNCGGKKATEQEEKEREECPDASRKFNGIQGKSLVPSPGKQKGRGGGEGKRKGGFVEKEMCSKDGEKKRPSIAKLRKRPKKGNAKTFSSEKTGGGGNSKGALKKKSC